MPSYPTSPYAPASKSAGQTIQASFFNDPDAELTAVESALLNGLAHPLTVGGKLTASSGLQVIGNSTLGSSITIGTLPYIFPSAGGSSGQVLTIDSTSGSTMTLKWAAATASVPDACRVELAAAQEIPNGSTVAISWTAIAFQTNSSMHSTAVNADRITPQSTGVYLCSAEVRWRTNASTRCFLQLEDSSGGIISEAQMRPGNGNISQLASGLKYFDALGGYVRAVVTSVGSTNSLENTGPVANMSIAKLR